MRTDISNQRLEPAPMDRRQTAYMLRREDWTKPLIGELKAYRDAREAMGLGLRVEPEPPT